MHADPLLDDEEEDEDQEIKDALNQTEESRRHFDNSGPSNFDNVIPHFEEEMNLPPRPGGTNAELPPPPRPPKKASLQVKDADISNETF